MSHHPSIQLFNLVSYFGFHDYIFASNITPKIEIRQQKEDKMGKNYRLLYRNEEMGGGAHPPKHCTGNKQVATTNER